MKREKTLQTLKTLLTFLTLIASLGAGIYFSSLTEAKLMFGGVASLAMTLVLLLAFYVLAISVIGFLEDRVVES